MSRAGDDHDGEDSDYDPLFDDGDESFDGDGESRPSSVLLPGGGSSLALPKYTGPLVATAAITPMRNVENVGTIALPASPSNFSEHSTIRTASSSDLYPLPTSQLLGQKRPHSDDAEAQNQRSSPIAPGLRHQAPHRTSTSSSRPSSSSPAPATPNPPQRVPPRRSLMVPRMVGWTFEPRGSFHQTIMTYLTYESEFISTLRSYLYLLANPEGPPTASGSGAHTPLAARKRTSRKQKVPAGAANWDVPFPFASNSAPEGYFEEWYDKKIQSLIASVKSALRRATVKVEVHRIKQELKISEWKPSAHDNEQRAQTASSAILTWLRTMIKDQARVLSIPIETLERSFAEVSISSNVWGSEYDQPLSKEVIQEGIAHALRDVHAKVLSKKREEVVNSLDHTPSTSIPSSSIASPQQSEISLGIPGFSFEEFWASTISTPDLTSPFPGPSSALYDQPSIMQALTTTAPSFRRSRPARPTVLFLHSRAA